MFELWVGVSSTSLPITTNTIHSTSKVKDHLTRLRPPKSGFYYYYDVSLMDSDCCVQFGTFGRRTLLLNILLWYSIYSWNNETTRLRPDYSRKKKYCMNSIYFWNYTLSIKPVISIMYYYSCIFALVRLDTFNQSGLWTVLFFCWKNRNGLWKKFHAYLAI